MNLHTWIRRARRDTAGAATVEFAMVLPLLLLLALGIIEFGRVWNTRQVVTDAAREGTRVAVVNNNRLSAALLQDSVRRTVQRRITTAALDTTQVTVTLTQVGAQQPGTPATITVQYNYSMLAGGFVLGRQNLPLRSTFVMRNE